MFLDIFLIFFALFFQFLVKLEKCTNWSQKLEALTSEVPSNIMNMAPEDQRNICTAVYNRLLALQSYNYATLAPIRSPIILLKPSQPTLRDIPEDYGLRAVDISI